MDMQPCPIGSLPAGIKKNKLGGVAMANERLLALRKRMAEEGIDAYYVPTSMIQNMWSHILAAASFFPALLDRPE